MHIWLDLRLCSVTFYVGLACQRGSFLPLSSLGSMADDTLGLAPAEDPAVSKLRLEE